MIPFSPPRIDQKIIDEVVDSLKSGWITTGPKTKLFEKKLTAYIGNKNTACLNSATAGMELMLRWFGVGPGDEVIVPAYTYCSTANVVVHCGATPVMADVSNDFNVTAELIKPLITARTKVIMPVDIGGYPCDMDALMALVNDKTIVGKFTPNTPEQKQLGRILMLSDSAHSIGAAYKGKKVGATADVSVYSFHAVKNLTTAEGGAVALNLPEPFDNELIYKKLCVSSLHGQNKDALAKSQSGGWRYDVVEPGYKCNMTDISAAIGLVELERYEHDTLVKRKKIVDKYHHAFLKYDWYQSPPIDNEDYQSSNHLFLLRIKGIKEAQRDFMITEIANKGVSVNVHFQPLPLLTVFKNKGYNINDYPIAFDNYEREITLPVFYDLTPEQQDIVISSVVEAVENQL
jgi:dTDP-4-amino-4,6-dideoxygalactose transaminase